MPTPDTGRSDARWLLGVAVVLVVGLVLPATTLRDPVLADSLTFRVKTRVLGPAGLFLPSSTEVVNPYYRPLYGLLQHGADLATGYRDLGLRGLALLCHAAAALMLVWFGRRVGLSRRAALVGLAVFLFLPGNAFTVVWPVVAYWSLAAALSLGAAGALVARTGFPGPLLLAFGLAALSLLSSQTAYHLPLLAGWMALLPPRPESRRFRLRAVVAAAGLGLLALLHFRFLEVKAQGLTQGDPVSMLASGLRHLPRYYAGLLGGDQLTGGVALQWGMAALVVLTLPRAPRPVWFLTGAALLAPLPFAAMGYSERYAYLASVPAALVLGYAFAEGWVLRGRLAMPLLVAFLGILGAHSWVRIQDVREVARETGTYQEDLVTLKPRLGDLSDVVFVNLPPMLKWNLNDLWRVDRVEDLIQPRNLAIFRTRTHYFGTADFTDLGARLVVEADRGHLYLRDPKAPLGERQAIAEPCFLAGEVEVLELPSDLAGGVQGELQRLRAVQDRLVDWGDPRARVLVEAPIPGLTGPLPQGPVPATLEPVPDPGDQGLAAGARFDMRLRARVDVPRPGLLVVVTYLTPEEPVHRVGGDLGRFCRHVEVLVDGLPAPVIPVYYHLTGVVIPAGSHEVLVQQRSPRDAPSPR